MTTTAKEKETVKVDKRYSGILLHPTSLPSPYGIGDLGRDAYEFVDFLEKAGQTLWQVLPLGPTGYGDSPYQSYSVFAGQILLISPEKLVEQGLIEKADLRTSPYFTCFSSNSGRFLKSVFSISPCSASFSGLISRICPANTE